MLMFIMTVGVKEEELMVFTINRMYPSRRYGVSVPALHKKPRRSNPYTSYPGASIRCIQGLLYAEIPKRYQSWSLLQEIPNTLYPASLDTAYRPVFRLYK
ncbi:hypothetical protein Tco_0685793 [Tanacetum coccineum]